jgi:hypothetical protein
MRDIQDLETKIADRANRNVQAKIDIFKKEIDAALTKLCGQGHYGCESFGRYEKASPTDNYEIARAKGRVLRLAYSSVASDGSKLSWPPLLWLTEENAIRNELLAKMDLMQQLLMTKERDTTNDEEKGTDES